MKSKLSIRAQHLHIGTNEARRSPTLIPLHLTHFIDSPCFPNEMLNISPSTAACWQPLLWRWREWERNVTVSHTHTHTHSKTTLGTHTLFLREDVKWNNVLLTFLSPSYQTPFIMAVIRSADMDQHLTFFLFLFLLSALIKCQFNFLISLVKSGTKTERFVKSLLKVKV